MLHSKYGCSLGFCLGRYHVYCMNALICSMNMRQFVLLEFLQASHTNIACGQVKAPHNYAWSWLLFRSGHAGYEKRGSEVASSIPPMATFDVI